MEMPGGMDHLLQVIMILAAVVVVLGQQGQSVRQVLQEMAGTDLLHL
jgi:hypothetical protein